MNIPQEELTHWRRKLYQANSALLQAQDAYRAGDSAAAMEWAAHARTDLVPVSHALERAGAEEPVTMPAPRGCVDPRNVPLELCASDANKRLAEALKLAYAAAIDVDAERHWTGDGFAETLSDWLEATELEVYGPKGTCGAE